MRTARLGRIITPSDWNLRMPSCQKILIKEMTRTGDKYISMKDGVVKLKTRDYLKDDHLIVND